MKSKNTNSTKSPISEINSNTSAETKFPTSVDFYYRLKHDPNIKTNGIKITYLDSMKKKYIDMDFSKWVFVENGGDIPMHRVYFFKFQDIIIWDREQKIINLEPVLSSSKLHLPDNFTILSWNILNPKDNSKKRSKKNNFANLTTKEIDRMNKVCECIIKYAETIDIICLQEVNELMKENIKLALDEKFGKDTYSIAQTNLSTQDNILIISKYQINSIEFITFSREKEAIKINMELESGGIIDVYAVHLTSDSKSNSHHKRLEQLEKIYTHFSNSNQTKSCIICGDFNEDNSTHRFLTETNKLVEYDLNMNNNIYTFDPNTNPLAQENSNTQTSHTFDKFYSCGSLHPIELVSIISDVKYSDHYAIKTKFAYEYMSDNGFSLSNANLSDEKNILSFSSNSETSTGLFIVVPPHADGYTQIQQLREEYDANYSKWMPHLSIRYGKNGWIPESEFGIWTESNKNIIERINCFDIILDCVDYFFHENSWTIIIKPSPNTNTSTKLNQIFKLFDSDKEPHLTLGKFKEKNKFEKVFDKIKNIGISVEWKMNLLHMVSKKNRSEGVIMEILKLNNNNNDLIFNSYHEFVLNFEKLIKTLFSEIKILMGGSGLYFYESNLELNVDVGTDMDILVIGIYEPNDFFQKANRFFQSCGYFIHSKIVSNEYYSMIRTIHYKYGIMDIHYIKMNSHLNLNTITDTDTKIKSSVYWDNKCIWDYAKQNNFETIFLNGLIDIKKKFKSRGVYGQEFCYIGGISLSIMLIHYISKFNPNEWTYTEFVDFCKYWSNFEYSNIIGMRGIEGTFCSGYGSVSVSGNYDQNNASANRNLNIHMYVKGPISNYNTTRNLTASTFNMIKYYLKNNFESEYESAYILKFTIGSTNLYAHDEIKSFIRSIYLKIILRIEKLIKNTSNIVYPHAPHNNTSDYIINELTSQYETTYEFEFNFDPISLINIFTDVKNKIISLYENTYAQIMIIQK